MFESLTTASEGERMLSKNGKSTPRVTSLVQSADFEGLLEAVPDALVGVDRAGVIQFANHQTEVLFGYDRDDLVGQVIEILVPESFRAGHQGKRELYLAAPRTRALGGWWQTRCFGAGKNGGVIRPQNRV